jgi:hypothetical protein
MDGLLVLRLLVRRREDWLCVNSLCEVRLFI